jgi:hypothetical protein
MRHDEGGAVMQEQVRDGLRLRRLANGLVEVYDVRSQLSGLWHADGTPRSGDLTHGRRRHEIAQLVREQVEVR